MVIDGLVLSPTAQVINFLSPADPVHLEGRSLVSSGSRLRITRGCEGVEMLMLLAAGILAFPAAAQHRAKGLVIGGALVYVLTVARLLLLHYTLQWSPGAWQALHGLILPLAPVILVALYFLHWSAAVSASRSDAVAHAV